MRIGSVAVSDQIDLSVAVYSYPCTDPPRGINVQVRHAGH